MNRSIVEHQVTTTIIADKVYKLGSAIQDATADHWWDLFTGYSPSASTMLNWLIHPVLILCLSIWNCVVFHKMCCVKQRILMETYVSHVESAKGRL